MYVTWQVQPDSIDNQVYRAEEDPLYGRSYQLVLFMLHNLIGKELGILMLLALLLQVPNLTRLLVDLHCMRLAWMYHTIVTSGSVNEPRCPKMP